MNRDEFRRAAAKANSALNDLPQLREALAGSGSPDEIRGRAEAALIANLARSGRADTMAPLEWVIVRDATHIFLNLLLRRNERISGFSLVEYLGTLLRSEWSSEVADLTPPSSGFFAELEHLTRGIAGKTGIYDRNLEETPVIKRHPDGSAAQRSADLNRLARNAHDHVDRIPWGLDTDVVRRRSRNRQRIMRYFGVTDVEWDDWRWHLKSAITDAETLGELVQLSSEERRAIRLATDQGIPFAVTPFYASLMDAKSGGHGDQAVRAQVIPSLHYVRKTLEEISEGIEALDFMQEKDTSPIEGITRRYPMICILKPIVTCPQICVYCQRNWQITNPGEGGAFLPTAKLNAAIDWIRKNQDIREVLVTGGDPFMMSNKQLLSILAKLSQIHHVKRIRIGTRTPVTMPIRITESLVRGINQYHIPGQREIVIVTHFEHPYEITKDGVAAIQKFRCCGMDVYNQLVYTFYNSRRFEACALRQKLRLIGVTPYYTFNTKGKEETADFRVPIARLLQEQKEEQRLFPGTVRTDEVVFNVPALGKNYLRAAQHHDIIAILPNGRRMYEFHPWEKKLAKAGTYVYTDVSIYDYLKRLREDGEKTADYRTIWYYY